MTTLLGHPALSPHERCVLTALDFVLTEDTDRIHQITSRALLSIAQGRNFSDDFKIITRYLGVMIGQDDGVKPMSVPRLYLSVFGNIHLSKQDTVLLTAPSLRYNQIVSSTTRVTALFSLLSGLIDNFVQADQPGEDVCEWLASFNFLSTDCDYSPCIPVPAYAVSLSLRQRMGLNTVAPGDIMASFYAQFLYKSLDTKEVTRSTILNYVLDVMIEKIGVSSRSALFNPTSYSRKLVGKPFLQISKTPEADHLTHAMEALGDDDLEDDVDDVPSDPETESSDDDLSSPEDSAETQPKPETLAESVSGEEQNISQNTIGLVAFATADEGADADLYRRAVIALNNRIQSDETFPITADVRIALNHWVNGYLYRTALEATKSQLSTWGLQTYLKKL
jgi:hypothetical protein